MINPAGSDKDDVEIVLVLLEPSKSGRIAVYFLRKQFAAIGTEDDETQYGPEAAEGVSPEQIHPRAPITRIEIRGKKSLVFSFTSVAAGKVSELA